MTNKSNFCVATNPNPNDGGKRKRGRPRIKKNEVASISIDVRVHPGVYLPFAEQCRSSGVSVANAVRQLIEKGTIQPPATQAGHDWSRFESHLLRQLSGAGNNLNQIVKLIHGNVFAGANLPEVVLRLSRDVGDCLNVLGQILAQIETLAKPKERFVPTKSLWRGFFGRKGA